MKSKTKRLFFKQQLVRVGKRLCLSTLMFFTISNALVKAEARKDLSASVVLAPALKDTPPDNGDANFLAQVTPDGSLPTTVQQQENTLNINGGEREGNNLFHSFKEFSVPEGLEAIFNNASDLENIFTRITGESASLIDGILRTQGGANLFLINPNGIIFGENASLDVGGSFIATTANSIQFEDGAEFTASDAESEPILTVSVPIGLNLDGNSGDIVNNSVTNDVGLQVLPGKNISLIGGNVNLDRGLITAPGGIVELGGLAAPGTIAIDENGSLIFPEDVAKADITLSNDAIADVRSIGGGKIAVNASNLDLTGNSELRAGIAPESTATNARSGDIEINLTNNLNLDNSNITNTVQAEGVGNSGDVNITTGSITATNGGRIDASTSGQGDVGVVDIIAIGDVTFDGENSEGDRSGVTSRVNSSGEGNARDVTISTANLTLTNGGRINSSTQGKGNAGLVDITAIGDVTFNGTTLEGDRSGATSRVDSGGEGNARGVTISTTNLTLINGGRIDASTSGQGDVGLVDITATGDITFNGTTLEGDRSGVTSRVNSSGEGNAGGINISTTNLNLANGGRIDAGTSGKGNGGNVNITATKDIILRNNSPISAQALGNASGGNLTIDARFIIAFPNGNNDIPLTAEFGQEVNFAIDAESQFGNDIIASAEQGQGGNITIKAESLFGIEERPLSNLINDINASSEFSLNGVVVIDTPDINLQKELEQSELELITAEQAIANSCLARSNRQASLTIGSDGGLPKNPNSNYSDANFSLTGVGSLPDIPIKAAPTQKNFWQRNQSLIPAEKMVETEDGRIFLVTAPYAKRYPLGQKAQSLFCHTN